MLEVCFIQVEILYISRTMVILSGGGSRSDLCSDGFDAIKQTSLPDAREFECGH